MKELKPYFNSFVTFGDGSKGKIIRTRKLDYPSLPRLDDVLLVEGLTTNIISISQLYDQELCVNINHYECIVINKHLEYSEWYQFIIKLLYVVFKSKYHPQSYMISKEDETKLWHKKLDHYFNIPCQLRGIWYKICKTRCYFYMVSLDILKELFLYMKAYMVFLVNMLFYIYFSMLLHL